MKRLLAATSLLVSSILIGGAAYIAPATASDDDDLVPPDPNYVHTSSDTVTICHATGNANDPYESNSPGIAESGDDPIPLKGHGKHNEPIFGQVDKGWGDIIPPFTYEKGGQILFFPGLNWENGGEEAYRNGCELPHVTAPAPVAVQPTCENPQGAITFTNTDTYVYTVDPAFHGPDTYTVTVSAIGAIILDPPTSWQITINAAPDCRTPAVPASVTTNPATCESAETVNVPNDDLILRYDLVTGQDGTSVTATLLDVVNYVLTGSINNVLTIFGPETLDPQKAANDPDCQETVTAEPPTFTPPTCTAAGAVVAPDDTVAINYTLTENEDGSITVTAEPTSDHYVVEGFDSITYTVEQLEKKFGDEDGCPTVVADVPALTQSTCELGQVLVLPETDGVTYTPVENEDGSITVTATSDDPNVELVGPAEFTVTPGDPLSGPECDPPAKPQETPKAPLLPNTGGESPMVLALGMLLAVLGAGIMGRRRLGFDS